MINKELFTMIDITTIPRIKGISAKPGQWRFRAMSIFRASVFRRVRSGSTITNIGFLSEINSYREVF